MHLFDISCPCGTQRRPTTSRATRASHLAKVVLDHAAMTEFCGIPLASLRENSITELNLRARASACLERSC